MNRPTMLTCVLIQDLCMQHGLLANKDVAVVQRRVQSEGLSFLTITLPNLGAALEQSLESGLLRRSDIPSFGHVRSSHLPKFLSGFWCKIFDRDGKLLSEPDSDAIFAIRQICYLMKKPKAVASDKRNRKAIRNFLQIEEDLKKYDAICSRNDPVLRRVSDLLWTNIFSDITPEDLVCRHGPGKTAEYKSANSRFTITHWPERSSTDFPMDLHCIPNYGHFDDLKDISLLPLREEPPVRVVQVPKTMKSPRTIAIEPSHMQYMQQGLLLYTVSRVESHPLTRDSVRFRDQGVNKSCARSASMTKSRATLDLSDASDRVHYNLVENIFKNSALLTYLQSSRSVHAKLPDNECTVFLRKFASMGSAMCFPVEAMVFYTLIQVALHYYHNEAPSRKSIKRFSRAIDVYGDDLIIPTYSRGIVTACLEAFGLKVSESKSFSNGFFRESCGGDYYNGYEVTPVYLRYLPPNKLDHKSVDVLVSLVETSNLLYNRGLWKSCQVLRDIISEIAPRKWVIPRSPLVTGGLTYLSKHLTDYHSVDSHQLNPMQKLLFLQPVSVSDALLTQSAFLMKALRPISSPESGRDYISAQVTEAPGLSWTLSPSSSLSTGCLSYQSHFGTSLPFETNSSVKRGAFRVKRRWQNAQLGVLAA